MSGAWSEPGALAWLEPRPIAWAEPAPITWRDSLGAYPDPAIEGDLLITETGAYLITELGEYLAYA